MNILMSNDDFQLAVATHPDPSFRTLLSRLLTEISCDGEFDPAELVRFAVIDPGDTIESVGRALGIALPSDCEAADHEGDWTAFTYILSDWGEGVVVLVPDRVGISSEFRALLSEVPRIR